MRKVEYKKYLETFQGIAFINDVVIRWVSLREQNANIEEVFQWHRKPN